MKSNSTNSCMHIQDSQTNGLIILCACEPQTCTQHASGHKLIQTRLTHDVIRTYLCYMQDSKLIQVMIFFQQGRIRGPNPKHLMEANSISLLILALPGTKSHYPLFLVVAIGSIYHQFLLISQLYNWVNNFVCEIVGQDG